METCCHAPALPGPWLSVAHASNMPTACRDSACHQHTGDDNVSAHVIVVGAGPVGLMMAGELRLGGADVVVVERLAVPTTESRASTLHARTMEIFDQRGLLAQVGEPRNDPMGHF